MRHDQLPPGIEDLLTDIAGDLGLASAIEFGRFFDALDLEGDGNVHAIAFLSAADWIAARRDRPVMERLEMIDRMRHLRGFNVIDLKAFTGWQ